MKLLEVEGEVFSVDLVTCIESLSYDFVQKVGVLCMPELCCCDMSGCIRVFQAIDPDVRRVDTISGDKADVVYMKNEGKWGVYQMVD